MGLFFRKLISIFPQNTLQELKLTPINKFHGIEFLYSASQTDTIQDIDITLSSLRGVSQKEKFSFAIDKLPLDIRRVLKAAGALNYVRNNLDRVIFCVPDDLEYYTYSGFYSSGVVAGQYFDNVAQFKRQRIGFVNPEYLPNDSAWQVALVLISLAAAKELYHLANTTRRLGEYAEVNLSYKELFNRYPAVITLHYALRLYARAGHLRISYQELKNLLNIIKMLRGEVRGYNAALKLDSENLDPLPFAAGKNLPRWLYDLLQAISPA
ncbi:MAG: hypothetical protein LBD99_06870 [Candidatus Margulisbacteria bacterium]|jgi:hypothetical protein|nr:hypothetical protein [Candidatus Margulisiibacteriota bacterium]